MPNNLDILLEVTTLPEQTLEDVQAYAPIRGAAGADGEDGQEVTLRVLSQVLQWKYISDPSYTDLIDFTTLTLAAAQITQDTSNRFVTDTEKTTWNAKQAALTNPVTGTGTTNNLAKFTASGTIGNSIASDDGSKMTVAGAADAFLVTSTGSGVTSELRQSSNNDVLHRFKRNGGNYWDARYFYTGEAFKFNYNDTPVLTLNSSGAATLAGALTAASASLTTPLTVGNGGTGLSTLTAGYIPFGNGTSAFGSSSNLFWDSANSRLGIGTTSPSTKLDVGGVVTATNSNDYTKPAYSFPSIGSTSGIGLFNSGSNFNLTFLVGNTLAAVIGPTGGGGYLYRVPSEWSFAWSSSNVNLASADAGLVRLDALKVAVGNGNTGSTSGTLIAANIGIGTSNPSYNLDVTGTGRFTGALTTEGRLRVKTTTDAGFDFDVNGTGRFASTLRASKLGIGVDPTYGIDIQSSDPSTAYIKVNKTGGASGFLQGYDDGVYFGAIETYPVYFRTAGATRMTLSSVGLFGIGVTPTAVLHLKAGTATANTAPLKLTAGTNLTTPENGAFEFDGTNLYFTVGGVRKTVTLV